MKAPLAIIVLMAGTSVPSIAFLRFANRQAVTVRVKRVHWRPHVRFLIIVGMLGLSAVVAASIFGGGRPVDAREQGKRATVMSSRAPIKPRSMLTDHIDQELYNSVAFENVSDGQRNKCSPTVVIATESAAFPAMGTPQKTNCAVKHGVHQRMSPINKKSQRVIEAVVNVTGKMTLVPSMEDMASAIRSHSLIGATSISAIGGLWKSGSSWPNATKSVVTALALGGVLLVCLGMLLGWSWTVQAVQPKLRHLAAERRRLNEEWSAVHNARRQRDECPRCGRPLSQGY